MPLMIIYKVVCWLKREHHYSKEIVIDDVTTRNYCKCGAWLEFNWSYMGGYRKAMNNLSNMKRKAEWDTR
ncbi:MAG: hypothetical protein ACT4N5_03560 [Nitrosopumilaceae archaeon]